jgi:hypothetical protein
MRILAIDDTRELTEAHVLVRNFNEGIRQLQLNGPWDLLLLDHDLASFDLDGREKTGYDVMCFLEENMHLAPKKIECVSANPVGRSRIVAMIVRLNEKIKQTSGDGHDL